MFETSGRAEDGASSNQNACRHSRDNARIGQCRLKHRKRFASVFQTASNAAVSLFRGVKSIRNLFARVQQLLRAAGCQISFGNEVNDLSFFPCGRFGNQRIVQHVFRRLTLFADGRAAVEDEQPVGIFLFQVFEADRLAVAAFFN